MHAVEEWMPYASAVFTRRFHRWPSRQDRGDIRSIVWYALRDYDPERGAWRPFLARRVIWRTIDQGRAEQAATAGQVPLTDDVDEAIPDIADAVVFADLVDHLPARERQALIETYVEGRTMVDLAARWGVDESRVWQIRARGARRLAGWLAA